MAQETYVVLDQFLNNWKEEILKFYQEAAEVAKGVRTYKGLEVIYPELSKQDLEWILYHPVEENIFGITSIRSLVEKDFQKKRSVLISRVEMKLTGKVVDVQLRFQADGNLNGWLKDENDKVVTVETIVAGGYNVQKAHYRVLVK